MEVRGNIFNERFLSKIQYDDGSFDEWHKGNKDHGQLMFPLIVYGISHLTD